MSGMAFRTAVVVVSVSLLSAGPGPVPPARIVVRPPGEIEFAAIVRARAFETGGMPGYHAIVWKYGGSARDTLLEADLSDLDALTALESLGARPANNVPLEAWDKRADAGSTAPQTVIAGPRIDVLLRLPGRRDLVSLTSVLLDSGGRGLDMRLGGHRDHALRWRSGCLVCLFSCPGSKVGNARYTVRDYVTGAARFRVRPRVLPPDGTRIGVVFRMREPSDDSR